MRLFFSVLAVAALLAFGAPAPVDAQHSGGSFGGSHFGGGGGGSRFGGGGYRSGGSSYHYRSHGGGGGGLPFGACGSPVIALLFVAFILYKQAQARQGNHSASSHGARAWNNIDVSAIRLGIDWRARKEVQAKLDALARSGNTATPQGLARMLLETVVTLQRAELAWLYANASNYHPMSAPMAEGIFHNLAGQARSKYKSELVRNADGQRVTEKAADYRAHPNEGEGVVVITVIVASRREIIDVHDVTDAARIKDLLSSMAAGATPQSLVALEVIWSPAAENDRMSTAELEQHYPELQKIDERSIAGRVFCPYCRGPYAMELLTCPHCGAPAPAPNP